MQQISLALLCRSCSFYEAVQSFNMNFFVNREQNPTVSKHSAILMAIHNS